MTLCFVVSGLRERLIEFERFFKEVETGDQVPHETTMGEDRLHANEQELRVLVY